MTTTSPLSRPKMPTDEDQARSIYTQMRRKLLEEDFEADLVDWIRETSGEDTADHWGVPDTSLNPLASNTRQLVTPGLYGRRPTVTVPAGGEALMGPGGYWAEAGIWGRNQALQYYVVGAGLWLRRLNVVDLGRGTQLVDRLVDPSNVYVEVSEGDPLCALVLWELRLRKRKKLDGELEWFYAWDKYDISGKTPTFQIMRCDAAGSEAEDVTAQFVKPEALERGYDWLDPAGRPFLPFVAYRATDTGCYWPMYRRGMHKGTLRACAHWTYTSRSALFATGEHVLLGNVDAIPGQVHHGDGNRNQSGTPTQTMRVQPGTISTVAVTQGQQMQSLKIGPGVNLPNLQSFASAYNMLLATADGVHPTDSTRQHANPTSGAALEINSRSRREFSLQVQPFFMASDLEAIRKAAWMLTRAGQPTTDEGYALEYHTIPLSPDEQSELREDLEWRQEQGQLGPVDVHLRLHPGKTREQATEDIIRARVEAASIEAEVAKRVEAAKVAAGGTGAEDIQKTAYNGAQVDAAREFLLSGAAGQLPRDAVKASLRIFFQLTDQEADALLGSIGNGFVPSSAPAPTPAPIQPGGSPAAEE
jgi:hypothetical protein